MAQKTRGWTAIPIVDEDPIPSTPARFYVLEGKCKRCGTANNSLVYTAFIENRADNTQSMFRTVCVSCWTEGVYFASEVVRGK